MCIANGLRGLPYGGRRGVENIVHRSCVLRHRECTAKHGRYLVDDLRREESDTAKPLAAWSQVEDAVRRRCASAMAHASDGVWAGSWLERNVNMASGQTTLLIRPLLIR